MNFSLVGNAFCKSAAWKKKTDHEGRVGFAIARQRLRPLIGFCDQFSSQGPGIPEMQLQFARSIDAEMIG
jgi:hypothetical protein